MPKKFTLPKEAFKHKGREVVAGLVFQDGVLVANDEDAAKFESMLTNFYAVTVEDVKIQASEGEKKEDQPSLAKQETKA